MRLCVWCHVLRSSLTLRVAKSRAAKVVDHLDGKDNRARRRLIIDIWDGLHLRWCSCCMEEPGNSELLTGGRCGSGSGGTNRVRLGLFPTQTKSTNIRSTDK